MGIIEIPAGPGDYRTIWPEGALFSPTSELATHLEIHGDKPRASVLHAHPPELIALTHLLPDEARINSALSSMHIEFSIMLPGGIGLVSVEKPGSSDLALATANALKKRDLVLWAGHGAVAAGDDLNRAFDLIAVANRAAEIYLMIHEL